MKKLFTFILSVNLILVLTSCGRSSMNESTAKDEVSSALTAQLETVDSIEIIERDANNEVPEGQDDEATNSDVDLLSWRDIYINYIPNYIDVFNENFSLDNLNYKASFQLINLNDDDIPELLMFSEFDYIGYGSCIGVICTIAIDGSIDEYSFIAESISYVERENLFCTLIWGGGFGGLSVNKITSIQNGKFISAHNGEFYYDFDGNFIGLWDGKEVSFDEYEILSNSAHDLSKSIDVNYDTGVDMQEIIRILNGNVSNIDMTEQCSE